MKSLLKGDLAKDSLELVCRPAACGAARRRVSFRTLPGLGRGGIVDGALGLLVQVWMLAWSAVLALGYLAGFTPWPGLRVLRSQAVTKVLLLSSTALVGGFTLAGVTQYCALLATWAVLFSSLNWLFHYFGSVE
jgi:hypothetical protein